MNAYSEDLRNKKIVEAVEGGMPRAQAARLFGVGISSVKRYVATAEAGLSLAPKKCPGSKPKMDETTSRLLEAETSRSARRPLCPKGASISGGWMGCG